VIRAQKAAKSPFFVARDRREREFACILGCFYGKIPGWGGVYTQTRLLFDYLLGVDHVIRDCTSLLHWRTGTYRLTSVSTLPSRRIDFRLDT